MQHAYGKKAASGIFALLGMWGIGAEVSILHQEPMICGNLLLLPFIIVLFRMYTKCFSCKQTKGFYWLTGGMSVVFSAMMIWGGKLDQLESPTEYALTGWEICAVFCLATAIFPMLAYLTMWLDQPHKRNGQVSVHKRVLFLSFFVVAAVWGLAYLAMFPGVLATDADYWYYEFSVEGASIVSQWSPFYCAVFYGLIRLGQNLFGSFNAGFAVFSFVQMVFILAVVWQILKFFYTNWNDLAVVLTMLFFTLLPTHVILALSSAQDPVFAACFAMCMIHLFELALQKSNGTKLFLWMVLLCMVRNNGIYVLLVMCIFAIVCLRKGRKQLVSGTICVIIFAFVWQGPVYDRLGIEKGSEAGVMLSLPLQQMAYVYNYGYERLSEAEIYRLRCYLSDEEWQLYGQCIADAMITRVDSNAVRNDPISFAKLYVGLFLTAPDCYIKAAGLQTFGLWYPNKTYPDWRIWHPYIEYLCLDTSTFGRTDFAVSRNSLFPFYDRLLGWLYGEAQNYPIDYPDGFGGNLSMAFSSIPILGILSKAGIYFWMLLYLFFYALYRRWKAPFAMIGMGTGLLLTVFFSPVMMYRYCAPVIFAAPLFAAIFLVPWDSTKKTKDERKEIS